MSTTQQNGAKSITTRIKPIKEIKLNPNNPRVIKDDKFKKLLKSIQEFPEMLKIRPIVVNADYVVLGGNMRLKACIDAGLTEVPIIVAEDLTEEQQKQFIIKDNIGYGEWDWDMLANQWDENELSDWGLDMKFWDENSIPDKDDEEEGAKGPSATDDDYSTFELIMLHENKLQLLDTLNKIKNNYLFEKQEDAMMELIRIYNK